MQTFMYTIKVPVGLHARHAGLLVKEVSKYGSAVTVTCGGRSADGRRGSRLAGRGLRRIGRDRRRLSRAEAGKGRSDADIHVYD